MATPPDTPSISPVASSSAGPSPNGFGYVFAQAQAQAQQQSSHPAPHAASSTHSPPPSAPPSASAVPQAMTATLSSGLPSPRPGRPVGPRGSARPPKPQLTLQPAVDYPIAALPTPIAPHSRTPSPDGTEADGRSVKSRTSGESGENDRDGPSRTPSPVVVGSPWIHVDENRNETTTNHTQSTDNGTLSLSPGLSPELSPGFDYAPAYTSRPNSDATTSHKMTDTHDDDDIEDPHPAPAYASGSGIGSGPAPSYPDSPDSFTLPMGARSSVLATGESGGFFSSNARTRSRPGSGPRPRPGSVLEASSSTIMQNGNGHRDGTNVNGGHYPPSPSSGLPSPGEDADQGNVQHEDDTLVYSKHKGLSTAEKCVQVPSRPTSFVASDNQTASTTVSPAVSPAATEVPSRPILEITTPTPANRVLDPLRTPSSSDEYTPSPRNSLAPSFLSTSTAHTNSHPHSHSNSHSSHTHLPSPSPVSAISGISGISNASNVALSITPLRKPVFLPASPLPSFNPTPLPQEPPYKGLHLVTATSTLSSLELQSLVSRAIRQSAHEPSIRLLRPQDVEGGSRVELARVEDERNRAQAEFRMLSGRRGMLLQGVLAALAHPDANTSETVAQLIKDLATVGTKADALATGIVDSTGAMYALRAAGERHHASALALALRKLNASYEKRVRELAEGAKALADAKDKVEALEREVEHAWAMAEDVAIEVDEVVAMHELEGTEVAHGKGKKGMKPRRSWNGEEDGVDIGSDSGSSSLGDEEDVRSPLSAAQEYAERWGGGSPGMADRSRIVGEPRGQSHLQVHGTYPPMPYGNGNGHGPGHAHRQGSGHEYGPRPGPSSYVRQLSHEHGHTQHHGHNYNLSMDSMNSMGNPLPSEDEHAVDIAARASWLPPTVPFPGQATLQSHSPSRTQPQIQTQTLRRQSGPSPISHSPNSHSPGGSRLSGASGAPGPQMVEVAPLKFKPSTSPRVPVDVSSQSSQSSQSDHDTVMDDIHASVVPAVAVEDASQVAPSEANEEVGTGVGKEAVQDVEEEVGKEEVGKGASKEAADDAEEESDEESNQGSDEEESSSDEEQELQIPAPPNSVAHGEDMRTPRQAQFEHQSTPTAKEFAIAERVEEEEESAEDNKQEANVQAKDDPKDLNVETEEVEGEAETPAPDLQPTATQTGTEEEDGLNEEGSQTAEETKLAHPTLAVTIPSQAKAEPSDIEPPTPPPKDQLSLLPLGNDSSLTLPASSTDDAHSIAESSLMQDADDQDMSVRFGTVTQRGLVRKATLTLISVPSSPRPDVTPISVSPGSRAVLAAMFASSDTPPLSTAALSSANLSQAAMEGGDIKGGPPTSFPQPRRRTLSASSRTSISSRVSAVKRVQTAKRASKASLRVTGRHSRSLDVTHSMDSISKPNSPLTFVPPVPALPSPFQNKTFSEAQQAPVANEEYAHLDPAAAALAEQLVWRTQDEPDLTLLMPGGSSVDHSSVASPHSGLGLGVDTSFYSPPNGSRFFEEETRMSIEESSRSFLEMGRLDNEVVTPSYEEAEEADDVLNSLKNRASALFGGKRGKRKSERSSTLSPARTPSELNSMNKRHPFASFMTPFSQRTPSAEPSPIEEMPEPRMSGQHSTHSAPGVEGMPRLFNEPASRVASLDREHSVRRSVSEFGPASAAVVRASSLKHGHSLSGAAAEVANSSSYNTPTPMVDTRSMPLPPIVSSSRKNKGFLGKFKSKEGLRSIGKQVAAAASGNHPSPAPQTQPHVHGGVNKRLSIIPAAAIPAGSSSGIGGVPMVRPGVQDLKDEDRKARRPHTPPLR